MYTYIYIYIYIHTHIFPPFLPIRGARPQTHCRKVPPTKEALWNF